MESVQVIPRELLSERIEEQIMDIPVPPIVEEVAEVVQIIPAPVVEYVAPALAISHTALQ